MQNEFKMKQNLAEVTKWKCDNLFTVILHPCDRLIMGYHISMLKISKIELFSTVVTWYTPLSAGYLKGNSVSETIKIVMYNSFVISAW